MPKEPWDLRTDDGRQEDGLATFIIFCEDEVSEPIYFRSFADDKVKINEIPNQRSKKLNLDSAVDRCTKDGLMIFDAGEGQHKVADNIKANIWCVYDRDLEHDDLSRIDARNNISFDTAISGATNSGMQVAWSNDCFELWILLHFEDVSTEQPFHRNYVYERLTDVYRKLAGKSADLEGITQRDKFGYKDTFKNRASFLLYVLPFLKDASRRDMAIERAEKLEALFSSKGIAFHQRNPCTMVHKLVRCILDAHPSRYIGI